MSVTVGPVKPDNLAVNSTKAGDNAGTRKLVYAGVDIGSAQIRAGVFQGAQRLLGKSKRSLKLIRGKDSVLERIARCFEDAVDESDLNLAQIQGIGVGLAGLLDAQGEMVISAPRLGWENVALRRELGKLLQKPVYLSTYDQLCALGIFGSEMPTRPRIFAAVIPGLELGGGLLLEGEPPPESVLQEFRQILERSQQALANEPVAAAIASLPDVKLRKAVRRGHPVAMAYALKAGQYAGQAIARIVRTFHPETVALGGGVVEEIKQDIMAVVAQAASKELGHDIEEEVPLVASILGDTACLAGGAFLACRSITCAPTASSAGAENFPSGRSS